MESTPAQCKAIEKLPSIQQGNASLPDSQVLNATGYVAEHCCKWRGLPERFSNWCSIYTRANRWAKQDVLETVFAALQENDVINIQIDHVSFDSTAFKLHLDGTGTLKTVSTLLANHELAGQPKSV